MTDVLGELFAGPAVVALSGPSFAQEVYARQPTAVVGWFPLWHGVAAGEVVGSTRGPQSGRWMSRRVNGKGRRDER